MRIPGRAKGAEFGPPRHARTQHPGPVLGGTVAPRPILDRIRHRIRLRNESLAIAGQRHQLAVRTAEFIRLTGPHNPCQPPEPMNSDFHHRLLMTFPLLGHRPVIDEGQLGIPMAANIGRQIECPPGPTGSGFRQMPMGVERAVRLAGREIESHVSFECLARTDRANCRP